MRLRTLWMALFLLTASAAAVAQSGRPIPNVAAQSNSIRERLSNTDGERMRWEAAQTWSTPVIPNQNSEADHRPFLIEQASQSALTVPKLRREWLTPALDGDTSNVPGEAALNTPKSLPFARPSATTRPHNER
jgi:hypothetical protein